MSGAFEYVTATGGELLYATVLLLLCCTSITWLSINTCVQYHIMYQCSTLLQLSASENDEITLPLYAHGGISVLRWYIVYNVHIYDTYVYTPSMCHRENKCFACVVGGWVYVFCTKLCCGRTRHARKSMEGGIEASRYSSQCPSTTAASTANKRACSLTLKRYIYI